MSWYATSPKDVENPKCDRSVDPLNRNQNDRCSPNEAHKPNLECSRHLLYSQRMKNIALSIGILIAFCFPVLAQNSGNAFPVPGAGLPIIVLAAIGCGIYWLAQRRRNRAKVAAADTRFTSCT